MIPVGIDRIHERVRGRAETVGVTSSAPFFAVFIARSRSGWAFAPLGALGMGQAERDESEAQTANE